RSHRGAGPSGLARIATVRSCCGWWTSAGWRRPFGAGEDRNLVDVRAAGQPHKWRRPFGAGEDRNLVDEPVIDLPRLVAPALRGWRGSHHRRPAVCQSGREWRRPFGAGEDRNGFGGALLQSRQSGAGPSGLARIATMKNGKHFKPWGRWRRPFGAGEDRNVTDATTRRGLGNV